MKHLKVIHLLHNIRKFLTVIFFFIIPVLISNAASPINLDTSLIDNFLRKTVNSYNIPGLAVALVNDKEIIYISAYGESSHLLKFGS